MNDLLYKKITEYIYAECGIHLTEKKRVLVESRLLKRMRRLGIENYDEYFDYVKSDTTGEEKIMLIDVISTNVTHFFREQPHFDFMKVDIQNRIHQGQRKFRIWCAAASSGEEPYSIAMTLNELTEDLGFDCRILATDISTNVLKKCKQGVYDKGKLSGIPLHLVKKYFDPCLINGEKSYQVKSSLASLLTFARLNLAKPPFPMSGPFDIVFIRNVMIYFDDRVKRNLLLDVHRLLRKGGHLIIGHSESMAANLVNGFERVGNSIFVKA